jgi:predicted nuclease of predicted toxin-antitoxin system
MRFKIDENLPVGASELLTRAGHDALTIHDQQMVGQPDPQVVSVCRSERRALLTLDLDFSDIRAYLPADYSRIIVLRPRSQAKPAGLSLIGTACAAQIPR